MKKRYLVSMIAMVLALMMLGLTCGAMADEGMKIGALSYLNMTEEENTLSVTTVKSIYTLLMIHGVLEETKTQNDEATLDFHHYDTLDAMLMALQAGEVKAISVPYYTAKYLCATNDGLKLDREYYPEKLDSLTKSLVTMLSDGYSFMMKKENAALRDDFNAQITAMKEDGTLQKLIDEHIIKAAETGEPVAVAFEKFEGDPIRIAVTGSLPPMDYVAADGSFAGFNTAVLAEIGKRLEKNIELVQVDSIGRALALSEGTVDVVFWTRGAAEGAPASYEEFEAQRAEFEAKMTEEDKATLDIEGDTEKLDAEKAEKFINRDLPEGTIITDPYFTDFAVMVVLK